MLQLTHYRRIAWTGGDVPCRGIKIADTPNGRMYRKLRHDYLREQLTLWVQYWHDMPDRYTRKIMWNRASLDAWATLTRQ